MSDTIQAKNSVYNTKLNWADGIYNLQKKYTGASSAQTIRTGSVAVPQDGFARLTQATKLGMYNGFATSNGLMHKIPTSIRNASVSSGLGAVAQVAPQLPSNIVLPFIGNIAAVGGSVGLAALVGTGAVSTYNPSSDKGFSAIPKALLRYGVLGSVSELPLRSLSGSSNKYVANVAGFLACAARLVLEVPRAVIAGAAAALFIGVPMLIGGAVGGSLNLIHALFSKKAVADLVASGSAVKMSVKTPSTTEVTDATTSTGATASEEASKATKAAEVKAKSVFASAKETGKDAIEATGEGIEHLGKEIQKAA